MTNMWFMIEKRSLKMICLFISMKNWVYFKEKFDVIKNKSKTTEEEKDFLKFYEKLKKIIIQ